MASSSGTQTRTTLAPGTPVEVLTSFATWTHGFRVAHVGRHGYRVARQSDGSVLPVELGFEQVRRA